MKIICSHYPKPRQRGPTWEVNILERKCCINFWATWGQQKKTINSSSFKGTVCIFVTFERGFYTYLWPLTEPSCFYNKPDRTNQTLGPFSPFFTSPTAVLLHAFAISVGRHLQLHRRRPVNSHTLRLRVDCLFPTRSNIHSERRTNS